MTVQELIRQLKKLPQESEVTVTSKSDECFGHEITDLYDDDHGLILINWDHDMVIEMHIPYEEDEDADEHAQPE